MDRDGTSVLALENKPRFRLAKISLKKGYQDWLAQEQLTVSDIWGYYIYDEACLTHLCSMKGSYWLEPIAVWGDLDSLKDVRAGRDLSDYMEDAGGDESLAFRIWFDEQLRQSFWQDSDGGMYVDDVESSILVLDLAEWKSDLYSTSNIISELKEGSTVQEANSVVSEDLMEMCVSGAEGEEIHDLFRRDRTPQLFDKLISLLSEHAQCTEAVAAKMLLWHDVTNTTVSAIADTPWKQEAIAQILAAMPDINSPAQQQYLPIELSCSRAVLGDIDTRSIVKAVMNGCLYIRGGAGQVEVTGVEIIDPSSPTVSFSCRIS